MPPLLCPSPVILDHSFPRDDYQLRTAALSLGNLLSCIQSGQSVLILTATLREFIKDIDWNSPRNHGLLREIYKTFSQLLLTTPRELLQVDVSSVSGHMPHPLPKGTLADKGNVGCCRFQRHPVRCMHETGGAAWSDASLRASLR